MLKAYFNAEMRAAVSLQGHLCCVAAQFYDDESIRQTAMNEVLKWWFDILPQHTPLSAGRRGRPMAIDGMYIMQVVALKLYIDCI